jgi:3-oxoacyl-[acyl-carrier protein] reductase
MYQNKYGKIVNVSSTNGINTYFPMCLDYDAIKASIISLTHNLAIQYAPYINVNAVAPGWVLTEKNEELDKSLNGCFVSSESENILLKRFAKVEEIAKVVLFLASDDASYINGEVIVVDGGC